jgi:hypothetical protein
MTDISDLPVLEGAGLPRVEKTARPLMRGKPSAGAQAPSARRVLVGSVLRGYREAARYRLDDAARILECDPSKISRIETGQRGIRAKELRELLTEYDADPQLRRP